ncbi:adenylate/guanylate cyclase domain-containing protein [Maribacter aestuarii]|uniref:adenylate/guanylate cyclase domain-containing protein n=1 Tax=Maribacter aestuarii TaxID=1130723 RepID=UPI00248CBC43|nr:adenylate/guanylate cyclase domain-containing protein [Maribacter aestuarii]
MYLKRFIKQILPFGLIWAGFAFVYSLVEYGLLGQLDKYPATGNPYDFESSLLPLILGSFLIGLLQGACEVRWFRRVFENTSLRMKILLKTLFYIIFIAISLVGFSILNSFYNYEVYQFTDALDDLKRFAGNFSFWSTLIFMGFVAGIAIFFSEMIQYVGDGVLYNALFSKYHKPISEIRIFMFLDMKSSTAIAETLGHEKYFALLKQYYSDMTSAILDTEAEIYQYVGDEIVLSWPKDIGLKKNNCIAAFLKITKTIDGKGMMYEKEFGVVPSFKAGYHIGEVTTGEIGTIKRNIIYTGDILNTAARLEAECNAFNTRVLISGELYKELKGDKSFKFNRLGELLLRGKQIPIDLYTIEF